MGENLGIFASLITAAGLGGVIGAYFQARFQHKATVGRVEHELKQKRYLCIIMLMLARIDHASGVIRLKEHRPDITNVHSLDHELRMEILNGMAYASQYVLLALTRFIAAPSVETFILAASEMRKDLWGSTFNGGRDQQTWIQIVEAVKNSSLGSGII